MLAPTKVCCLLIGLFTALAPSPASARKADIEPVSVLVATGDLDLRTADGRAVLERRVHLAARRACGGLPRGMFERESVNACRAAAVSDALSNSTAPAAGVTFASRSSSR